MAERAFDEFFASNDGRLVVQLYAVTGVLADAEDAVQEAFARASVRWRRVRVDNLELMEALKALPLPLRQVIVLHYLTDLPVEQVAGELGIAVGTAKSRLSRAREALAGALASGEEEVARDRR